MPHAHVPRRLAYAVLLPCLVAASACDRGRTEGASAGGAATDSSSRPDSAASAAPLADSSRADSARADTSAAAPTAATAGKASTKQDQYLGRDSAFGPKFAVDSAGKLVPIGTKKP